MIWARIDIVDPTWTSRTRPGTDPWSGLDPSQRLWNDPGMLLAAARRVLEASGRLLPRSMWGSGGNKEFRGGRGGDGGG